MTILVSASGSSIGLEVARSLRLSGYQGRLLGTEVSWWGEKLASEYCDEVVLLPRGDQEGYRESLLNVLEEKSIQLGMINTDPELEALASFRDQVDIPLSCPAAGPLAFCLDKGLLHEKLEPLGLVAPTAPVKNVQQLEAALQQLGAPSWLRCSTGPRGRGSILIERAEQGGFWIDYWNREGEEENHWLLHQYLPGRNFNWTSLWWQGQLVASAAGERLAYFLSQVAVSGVTGNVSHAHTVVDGTINDIAQKAVLAIDPQPHGVYSVDLKEASKDVPLVTEINARQAFRPLLYSHGGVNFSAILAGLVSGEFPDLPPLDAIQPGMEIIRGMDFEPIFRSPT